MCIRDRKEMLRCGVALVVLVLSCTGESKPRSATIQFDGTSFSPSEVEIDAGGYLTVITPDGVGSSSMFGQPMQVTVPDAWLDVDGIGLRLVEMADDTEDGRCTTGAFSDSVNSMWKQSWGQHTGSPFKRGLSRRSHDFLPGPEDNESGYGSYQPGVYYARRTWGANDMDPYCRRLDPFPAYFKLTVV
eukprot:TRINITY_DN9300_c0_g1_i1.p1 TRINITY_DN9300_c0_g1~~TRINITY_DN9300_c0_g1_i1.p1  ORF type:complete len:188 (+),score=32.91 TRINITY_DN9300_c0_g1_i1:187-750(+)